VALLESRPEPRRRDHLQLAAPPPIDRQSPRLPPPEQLFGYLVQFRRHGTEFDTAWDRTVSELISWPPSKRDTADWRKAIAATREGWRAAFEQWEALPREAAVGELVRILSEEQRRAHAA
jgi:hypothetical protein